jgi:hypothetical protein
LWEGNRSRPIGSNSYFGGANFEVVSNRILIDNGCGAPKLHHDVGAPKLAINNANSCVYGNRRAIRRNDWGRKRAVERQQGKGNQSSK